jgi:hypothetical protein
MLDQILSTLQQEALPQLTGQLGLSEQQAHGAIQATANSLQQVVGGSDGFGLDDVLNLFSQAQNTSGADGILSKIGQVLTGKLTSEVGLSSDKASGVQALLLPLITNLITRKVGGDHGNLQNLIGSFTGNQAGAAGGLIGKLFN